MCKFEIKDNVLVKYYGDEVEVKLPDEVQIIAPGAFCFCQNLKNVIIGKNVIRIEPYAFYCCDNLEIKEKISKDTLSPNAFYKSQKASLESKELFGLNGMNFYIKNYQRGYRWDETEITELLEDIKNIEGAGYCMQPLVVKKLSSSLESKKLLGEDNQNSILFTPEVTYELIDGQQRLTTLWLILDAFNYTKIGYKIYYELKRGVDEFYINDAKKVIKNWVEQEEKKDKNFKYEFLLKLEKLFFIWYEVKNENQSAGEVFKNINDGKVPLTNAELFKALLLNPDNIFQTEKMGELEQIAFEWDKIEGNLRDEDFWYFISNDHSDKKTRIDYIMEVYAYYLKEKCQKLGRNEKIDFKNIDFNKERFAFLVVQKYLNKRLENSKNYFDEIRNIWEDVVKVYNKLYSWYKDDELYHSIGFLVEKEDNGASSKATASEVVCKLYMEYKDKPFSQLKKEVRKKIYNEVFCYKKDNKFVSLQLDDIKYDTTEKDRIRQLLLFSNIYSMYFKPNFSSQNSKEDEEKKEFKRFPFRVYKSISWDIEHISPRTLDEGIDKAKLDKGTFVMSIKSLKNEFMEDEYLNKEKISVLDKYLSTCEIEKLKNEETEAYKQVEGYKECCDLWKEYAKEKNQNPNNSLSNLTLLDSRTNRSYGNAFFNEKRKKIIERDKEGSFVLLCTKNVFLKYYTEKPDNLTRWTEQDGIAYREQLEEMFKFVSDWNK